MDTIKSNTKTPNPFSCVMAWLRLNVKPISKLGDFHYEDMTVAKQSYISDGSSHTGKTTPAYRGAPWYPGNLAKY